MSINAYNDDDSKPGLTRFIVPGGIALGLIGAALLVHSLMGSGPSAPKRQTVKIAVLPDTPPPPPPPKPEKPPEPKPQDNTPQPQDQPKLAEAPPEPQQLKMEGAAGDGPSAFSAGSVSSDYKGGAIGAGNGASAPSAGDRAKFNFYAKSAQQVLRAELDRTVAALKALSPSGAAVHSAPAMGAALIMQIRAEGLQIDLVSTVARFGAPHDTAADDLRIEFFYPADSRSEAALRSLAGT